LFVIASMLLWAIYTIGLRWKPTGLHPLTFLFVIASVGDTGVLPVYLSEMAMGSIMAFTLVNVLALLGVALFSSVLAYIFWNRGVEQVGASVAGLFVHLMPVFGTILAWVFLGERLHAYHALGIAFILTGIYATSRGAVRAIAVPLE
jgi:drug/metabolite transporter (DMT)-like permease